MLGRQVDKNVSLKRTNVQGKSNLSQKSLGFGSQKGAGKQAVFLSQDFTSDCWFLSFLPLRARERDRARERGREIGRERRVQRRREIGGLWVRGSLHFSGQGFSERSFQGRGSDL